MADRQVDERAVSQSSPSHSSSHHTLSVPGEDSMPSGTVRQSKMTTQNRSYGMYLSLIPISRKISL